MDIGIFTDTFLPVTDGVGRVAVAYAYTLSSLGHRVTVSCPKYAHPDQTIFPFQLLEYNAPYVPTLPQYRYSFTPLNFVHNQALAQAPMQIAHAHTPFMSGHEAWRQAKQKMIPLVCTFHSKYYDDFLKIFHSKIMAKWLTSQIVRFYNKCDEVWAVSESSAAVLQDYGYSKHEPFVMPNGVEFKELNPESYAAVNHDYQLANDPVFLYVGQMNWKKNILLILEAAAALKQEGQNFRLVLVGQGPDDKEIRQKIAALGLASSTVMTGHITDSDRLNALYARAQAFVFPSLYDTSGMVVREAAIMGTPSILARGGSASEGVEDQVNGYICDPEPQALAACMRHILEQPEAAKVVGLKAHQTIPVSWDSMMEKVLARYQYLIDRYPG